MGSASRDISHVRVLQLLSSRRTRPPATPRCTTAAAVRRHSRPSPCLMNHLRRCGCEEAATRKAPSPRTASTRPCSHPPRRWSSTMAPWAGGRQPSARLAIRPRRSLPISLMERTLQRSCLTSRPRSLCASGGQMYMSRALGSFRRDSSRKRQPRTNQVTPAPPGPTCRLFMILASPQMWTASTSLLAPGGGGRVPDRGPRLLGS
mmetsp:Transcript_26500/g.85624  ORF Transcript_26500/g.85624 Transcript_26500/m.85624 type:complete len:205 (-) Transcript_26500:1655-2269(-)